MVGDQADEEGFTPSSEPWLDDEEIKERENLDRLAGDADLAATLRARGFAGSRLRNL